MKKVTMIVTKKGSQDGVTVQTFENGESYTISDYLADVFIHEGWAEPYEEKPEILTPEKPAQARRIPERGKR